MELEEGHGSVCYAVGYCALTRLLGQYAVQHSVVLAHRYEDKRASFEELLLSCEIKMV